MMKEIRLNDLIIFKDFADSETINKAVSLFSNNNRSDFIEFQKMMVEYMESAELDVSIWKNYIIDLLASGENIFSFSAENNRDIKDSLIWKLSCREFLTIKSLFELDFKLLINTGNKPHSKDAHIQNIADENPLDVTENARRYQLVAAMEKEDPNDSMELLYEYYRNYGSGQLESGNVFEWKDGLSNVKKYDNVSFDELIGYDYAKEKLIENTEFLLDGKNAANTLLYGDSGTGKSSSVKALVNRYNDRGLKLISIDKNQIVELTEILDFTSSRGCKFIIFIDDLSFEDNDLEYKHFKSVLEGNVKSHAFNTVIYVTSNRRNIIREVWSEREGSDDVHLRDTLQEKKSLSDRFGLVITYSAPTKDEYLDIVKGLAARNSILIDEYMIAEALKWDVRRANRSGRTAKYFIDYYLSREDEKEQQN